METGPEIVAEGLSKRYGENQVLDGFSHVFPAGRTTVVMGPSGRGKTTLLRLLLGLEPPDKGTIKGLEGARLSAVFQEDRLCERISAAANLRLVQPRLTRGAAEDLLARMGLGEAARQPAGELSGGMKRRVALLRALAADYDALLADEPFQGLDADTKAGAMAFFRERTAGRTVLLVTHDEAEAAFFGGEVLRL